ncbi:hypothetical protein [Mucilaginibacter gracilis]|uniref:hypothetical protein n=1 Tax=Mucilaginibacter gracilis TaxID=423350 RepID=UPI000EB59CE4|nr:hypothetical protein [Mucilaginibacter gracilis]
MLLPLKIIFIPYNEATPHYYICPPDFFSAQSIDVFINRLRKHLAAAPSIRVGNVNGAGDLGFVLKDRHKPQYDQKRTSTVRF